MNNRTAFLSIFLALIALTLSACAPTTPRTDFRMTTSELAPEDMQVFVGRETALPNEWFADNVSLEIDQQYVPREDGIEILASQRIRYTRLTEPAEAAQVAMARSEDASELGKAISSAGTTVLIEAIGAQLGIATAEISAAIENAKIAAEERRAEREAEAESETDPAPEVEQ